MAKIEYLDVHCEASPSGAHYLLQLPNSNIWRCKYCWAAEWLPGNWYALQQFSIDIRQTGFNEAYSQWLNRMPSVSRMLRLLGAIRLVRGTLNNGELSQKVQHILAEQGRFSKEERSALAERSASRQLSRRLPKEVERKARKVNKGKVRKYRTTK